MSYSTYSIPYSGKYRVIELVSTQSDSTSGWRSCKGQIAVFQKMCQHWQDFVKIDLGTFDSIDIWQIQPERATD